MTGWMRLLCCCAALLFGLSACGDDSSSTDTGGEDAETTEDAATEVPTDVPGETPTDTPGEVPVDVPVDVPADVPSDTPVDTPVDVPTDGTPTMCDLYCGPVVDAGCRGGPPTLEACLSGCATVVATCPTEFGALAACAGDTPTIACDAGGSPIVTGCEAEHAALLGCMGGGPCGNYCAQAVLTTCSETPESYAQCAANCHGSAAACTAEFSDLSTCAGDTFTVACDSLGRVAITGCETEYADLMQCAVLDPCTAMCGPTVDEGCTAGPPTLAACVTGCAGVAGNGCIEELTALGECAGADPTIVCNTSDRPVVEGCETEDAAFLTCGS